MRTSKLIVSLVVSGTVLGAVIGSKSADAAVLVVCPLACAFNSVSAAVSAAAPNDTVSVDDGTYLESSIVIDKSLIIVGQSQAGTIIDAGSADRIFHIVAPAGAVDISSLTLTNGFALTGGGAILAEAGDIAVNDVLFTDNEAALSAGGAIMALGTDTLAIESSDFVSNTAAWGGGAIEVRDSGQTDIVDSRFLSNMGINAGGAISIAETDTTIVETLFDSNSTTNAIGSGGGAIVIYHNSPTPHLTKIRRSSFRENYAAAKGGAIAFQTFVSSGTLKVSSSTFDRNGTDYIGGAIQINDVLATDVSAHISNSTFSENTSLAYGGALSLLGEARIANSTFYANDNQGVPLDTGDALYVLGGLAMVNNILSAHPTDECVVVAGSTVSGAGNLADTTTCSAVASFSSGAVTNLDPVLANNGGFTDTHALLPGSNAMDAGRRNCPNSTNGAPLNRDQRGTPRPQGPNCDVGSFEL